MFCKLRHWISIPRKCEHLEQLLKNPVYKTMLRKGLAQEHCHTVHPGLSHTERIHSLNFKYATQFYKIKDDVKNSDKAV